MNKTIQLYKTFLTVLITTIILLTNKIEAQTIDSLKIIPQNPTTNDTIKVISYTTFSSSPCSLGNSSINIADTNITIYTSYNTGIAPAFCNSIDTLTIGKLNAGSYELTCHLIDTAPPTTYDIDTIFFTVSLDPITAGKDSIIQLLLGKWQWDSSFGGFGPMTYKPSTVGYNKFLSLFQDSFDSTGHTISYTLYKNDTLIKSGRSSLSQAFSMYHNDTAWAIDSNVIEEVIYVGFILIFYSDSTIGFGDGAFDGFVHFYKRDTSVTTLMNNKINKYLSINVYPNPFSKTLTFEIKTASSNFPLSFTLSDPLGRVVKEMINVQKEKFTINRQGLSDGIYFFEIKDSKGNFVNGKVVVR